MTADDLALLAQAMPYPAATAEAIADGVRALTLTVCAVYLVWRL